MTRSRIAQAAAGLAASAALFAAAPAAAFQNQPPLILVLNEAQVVKDSKAGQSVAAQLEKLGEQVEAELAAEADKLRKEGEQLQEQRELLAEDAFQQQVREFQQKQQRLQQLRDVKVRELQISENQAIQKISEALRPILEEIVETREATHLLDRSQLLYVTADFDISQEVLQKLDAKLQTVAVERVDLQKLAAEARAAQEQQAAANGE